MGVLEDVKDCFMNLRGVEEARRLAERTVRDGISFRDVFEAMKEGLDVVGDKYDVGEYFLSDLIMAGIMATEFVEALKPHIPSLGVESKGRIIIGTVEGDIHDIGKNLVSTMLSVNGFEVLDIGVNVSPEKFVDSVERFKPDILAMSCLLTAGLPAIRNTLQLLRMRGLNVKVMIGGRPITREFAEELGVGYGRDAIQAVKVALELIHI
ncbi:MAG: cobalamin-dependent protein [Candidatus Bathyarchaeia archaeon]|nr:cobalamin-dependent protein [Candidatus Bathyarchaeota archaeon]